MRRPDLEARDHASVSRDALQVGHEDGGHSERRIELDRDHLGRTVPCPVRVELKDSDYSIVRTL